jgi:DNA-directed RNA polymerase specialized sigma subunit
MNDYQPQEMLDDPMEDDTYATEQEKGPNSFFNKNVLGASAMIRNPKDVENDRLWQRWNETRSKEDMDALMKAVEPILDRTISYNKSVNKTILKSQARTRAAEAFESYRPDSGASLRTHVVGHLKPLVLRSHTNTRMMDRGRHIDDTARAFHNKMKQIEEEQMRRPTYQEMAAAMSISEDRAKTLMQRATTYEMPESQMEKIELESPEDARLNEIIDFVYYDLPERDKEIFDQRTGRNGKTPMTLDQVARKHKISTAMAHKIVSRIGKKIDSAYGAPTSGKMFGDDFDPKDDTMTDPSGYERQQNEWGI